MEVHLQVGQSDPQRQCHHPAIGSVQRPPVPTFHVSSLSELASGWGGVIHTVLLVCMPLNTKEFGHLFYASWPSEIPLLNIACSCPFAQFAHRVTILFLLIHRTYVCI